MDDKLRLSVGGAPAQRALGAVVGLVFAAGGAAFLVLPLIWSGALAALTGDDGCAYTVESGDLADLPPDLLPDCSAGGGWWHGGAGPFALVGLVGLPFMLLGLYLALRAVRGAAWLEGTTARVRGALLTRTVDLATAEITPQVATYSRDSDNTFAGTEQAVSIVARDPETGRRVTIALLGRGASLPPHELRALSAAMTAGRSTDGRNRDAHTVAGQLLAIADNPLGL